MFNIRCILRNLKQPIPPSLAVPINWSNMALIWSVADMLNDVQVRRKWRSKQTQSIRVVANWVTSWRKVSSPAVSSSECWLYLLYVQHCPRILFRCHHQSFLNSIRCGTLINLNYGIIHLESIRSKSAGYKCDRHPARGTIPGQKWVVDIWTLFWSPTFVLITVGWARHQAVMNQHQGFGQMPPEPGLKANLMNLIHSIRTVMRSE